MSEEEIYYVLRAKLIEIGIDEKRIVREYSIGKYCRVDCAVLSADNQTPMLCFEVKAKLPTAVKWRNVLMSREYQEVSRITQKYIGVDTCYLVYFDSECKQVFIQRYGRRIGLKAGVLELEEFLKFRIKDAIIISSNHVTYEAIYGFKKVVLWILTPSMLSFVFLDILGVFPLTIERLIFICVMIGLVAVPYLMLVFIAHPTLFNQIIKALNSCLQWKVCLKKF